MNHSPKWEKKFKNQIEVLTKLLSNILILRVESHVKSQIFEICYFDASYIYIYIHILHTNFETSVPQIFFFICNWVSIVQVIFLHIFILIRRNKNTQIYCASFFCLCCSKGTIIQNPHAHYANCENHYIMEHAKYRPLCPFSWQFQNFWLNLVGLSKFLVGTLPGTMACNPGNFLIQNCIDKRLWH